MSREEAQDLVDSGDLKVELYRGYYRMRFNRDSSLTDEQIIDLVRWAEDDMDPIEWSVAMEKMENGAKPEDISELKQK